MTLMFGNLTIAFVNFGKAIQTALTDPTNGPAAIASAAQTFRTTAAKDASYLVYIGEHTFYLYI